MGTLTETNSLPSSYSEAVVSGSVRFFHKFDPIASDYLWGGAWKHNAATAYFLYDESGCTSAPGGGISLSDDVVVDDWTPGDLGSEESALTTLYSYLCTGKDVSTNSLSI